MDTEAQNQSNKKTQMIELREKRTLSKDWRWTKLGDVCQTTSGGTPQRGVKEYYNGNIPWVKSGELNDGLITSTEETVTQLGIENSSAKIFPAGTLLIALYGATVGRLGILNMDAATNQAVCAIYTGDEVDKDFLFFYLLSKRSDLLKISFGGAQPNISQEVVRSISIPLLPLNEQIKLAAHLNEQMQHIERARQGIEEQLSLVTNLVNSYFRESLQRKTAKMNLSDCMVEVKKGVGETWAQYPVLGATRAGVAPAKEKVGKQPQRYKLVEPGTIFYNPMRIMIGSIAMLDDGDESGITSPDYVVLKGKEGILHPRWFYYWLRSPYGENFIKSLARGAVRERMLFNRLDKGEIDLPDWETQVKIAEKLKEIKTFKQALESQLAKINELLSALLRQAFASEA
ncbi:MAG: hypothetical protein B6D38_00695 [Anaerolineae bacterium UTCFX1]|jgi:type I restriction enzyme S subunit|nr:MAG: hypothetical protein B6D38_00695 [Anaerolineae bacterium UTCFX1]